MKSGNECAQCGANLIEPEWSETSPIIEIKTYGRAEPADISLRIRFTYRRRGSWRRRVSVRCYSICSEREKWGIGSRSTGPNV